MQTDERTDGQTDKRDEANIPFSQYGERASKVQYCLRANRRVSIQLILRFFVSLSAKLTLKNLEQVLNISITQRGEIFENID
jgi:hypothetical protein